MRPARLSCLQKRWALKNRKDPFYIKREGTKIRKPLWAQTDCALEILRLLDGQHPEARILLDYRNPFELLVATILAAQCTDERVNQVTKTLFGRVQDPAAMAEISIDELEELIHSTGLFRAKSKRLCV